ncbi:translation elongation factor-like protein [Candidatus Omnitrophota bacterium]
MILGLFKKRKPRKISKEEAVVEGELIGKVTHYFTSCKAGVIKLKKPLAVGDKICVDGHTTKFKQKVSSMQVDGKAISSANKGKEVGVRVKSRVRINDAVYKL